MRLATMGCLLVLTGAACQPERLGSMRLSILGVDGPGPFVGAVSVRLRVLPDGPESSWPIAPGQRIDVGLALVADGESHQLLVEGVTHDGRVVGRGISRPVTFAEGADLELEVVARPVGQSSMTLDMLAAPRVDFAMANVPSKGVCLFGGGAYGTLVTIVDCFDPWLTQQFEAPPLPEGRRAPLVVVTEDGTVIVAGGGRDDAVFLPPAAGAWSLAPGASVSGDAVAPTGADAWIVVGAALDQAPTGATQRLTWQGGAALVTTGPVLRAPRDRPTASALGGDVLIVGGSDTVFGEWLSGGEVEGPGIRGHAAAIVGDVALVVGGGDTRIQSVSKATGRVEQGKLAVARTSPGAEALPDGRVLVVGGAGGGPQSAEVLSIVEGLWTSTATISLLRSHVRLRTAVLAGGAVLTIGGEAANGGLIPDGEVFVP